MIILMLVLVWNVSNWKSLCGFLSVVLLQLIGDEETVTSTDETIIL